LCGLPGHTLGHSVLESPPTYIPGLDLTDKFCRYGFFDRTINEIEMVLADGEIVTASPTERPDLFYGAASSFGTLGVTTLLELQLIDAKRYVELTYHPVRSISDAVAKIKETTADPAIDYVDGIMYGLNRGVICAGRLTDEIKPGVKKQQFTRAHDPWFYMHAHDSIIKSSETSHPQVEAVPLRDYLFRYDRGGFWVGHFVFSYFITPFNRLTRWLFDYFLHTRMMYAGLQESGLHTKYVIQDVAIPLDRSEEFFAWLQTFSEATPSGCVP
jgi:delta24-sterol reductase